MAQNAAPKLERQTGNSENPSLLEQEAQSQELHGNQGQGSPQGPQEAPRVQGPGPGAATEDVEALGPAFYPKRSFKPDSQGLQAAFPASRRGIAGHLLPPIGDFKPEDAPAEGLQDDNGKVPLHAQSAGAGAPNCRWQQEIRDPVGPLRGFRPPALAVGPSRVAASLGEEGGSAGSVLPPSSPWPWPRQVSAPERPQVPSGRSPERVKRGARRPIPSPAPGGSPAGGRVPSVRRPLPAACGRGAQGRGRAAAPGRRRKARHRLGHGRRRAQAEARAPEGRGRRARRGPGLRAPARPSVQQRSPGGRRARQAPMAPGQLQRPPRAWWGEAVPTRVRPAARLSLAHSEPLRPRRPRLWGWRLPRLPPPGPGAANPSLPASRDFPDGAMLSFQDNQGSSPPGDLSRRPPPEIPRRFPPCRYQTGNSSH
nr:uncharacterized protein LOC111768972 [Equus caballus]